MPNASKYSVNKPKIWVFAALMAALVALIPQDPGLKTIFNKDFYMDAAVGTGKIRNADSELLLVLDRHFNSISPENLLKWESVHPRLGEYRFRDADSFVALGEKLGCFSVGHTLVWHNQTPNWVFQEPDGSLLAKKALLSRMEEHIEQVVGRYKGQINGWDVVNEAFTDDGEFRNSHWFSMAGVDFIKQAFRKASLVDPSTELYYNDYNVWKPSKIDAVLAFAKSSHAEGVQIDGIGMQGHYGLTNPAIQEMELSIDKIHQVGFKVRLSELDIDVLPKPTPRQGAEVNDRFGFDRAYDPYTEELPAQISEKLADRYAALF